MRRVDMSVDQPMSRVDMSVDPPTWSTVCISMVDPDPRAIGV